MDEIKRIGYGSNFNKISVDKSKNIIRKECINDYGMKKIKFEKIYYNFLINNNINFPYPKIHSFFDNGYEMEYLSEYFPLYQIYSKLTQEKQKIIIEKINFNLNLLHNFEKKMITMEEYYKNLNIEIEEKITERFQVVKPIVEKYDFIKSINQTKIIPFFELIELIKNEIYSIVEKKEEYFYVPLHGDCQFNNILYNTQNEEIYFIDPRGYYGTSELFGIPEYDHAKIYFALSGYDEFDNRDINELHIFNDDIEIKLDNSLNIHELEKNNLSILLMLNIWLGNAHCFIKNENKAVYSYFIGLYLGSLYFSSKHIII
jgi:hypothetical protein